MAEQRNHGQAAFGEVKHLPELVIDMGKGQPQEGLGGAEAPAERMLPILTFDFADVHATKPRRRET